MYIHKGCVQNTTAAQYDLADWILRSFGDKTRLLGGLTSTSTTPQTDTAGPVTVTHHIRPVTIDCNPLSTPCGVNYDCNAACELFSDLCTYHLLLALSAASVVLQLWLNAVDVPSG